MSMDAELAGTRPPRILPALTDIDRPYWTSGADGRLRIQHCATCDRYVHPPVPACPTCGTTPQFRSVSGRGSVFTFTVNHQPFHPDVPPPYVIAIVELEEQDDLRLPTNLVDCDAEAVAIGQPVEVVFEQQGEHWIPLFRPL